MGKIRRKKRKYILVKTTTVKKKRIDMERKGKEFETAGKAKIRHQEAHKNGHGGDNGKKERDCKTEENCRGRER